MFYQVERLTEALLLIVEGLLLIVGGLLIQDFTPRFPFHRLDVSGHMYPWPVLIVPSTSSCRGGSRIIYIRDVGLVFLSWICTCTDPSHSISYNSRLGCR